MILLLFVMFLRTQLYILNCKLPKKQPVTNDTEEIKQLIVLISIDWLKTCGEFVSLIDWLTRSLIELDWAEVL